MIGLAALVVAAVATIALASGGEDGGELNGRRQGSPGGAEADDDRRGIEDHRDHHRDDDGHHPAAGIRAVGRRRRGAGHRPQQRGLRAAPAGRRGRGVAEAEKSVASFPSDSTQIDYAYALFNYAQALRLSGDPEAAIPLLEKRLSFSDFKLDEVKAELAASRQAAARADRTGRARDRCEGVALGCAADRAERGGSGALYPQSAPAGLNARPRIRPSGPVRRGQR